MKRLPKLVAAFALGGCSPAPVIPDAGHDSGVADAGATMRDGRRRLPLRHA